MRRRSRVLAHLVSLAVGLGLFLWGPSRAAAFSPLPGWPPVEDFAITTGVSTGVFLAKGITAGSVTAEVTGAWKMAWLSAGFRGAFQPAGSHLMPYLEAGLWLYANIGVGYTLGFSVGERDLPLIPRHNVHLFVGVPIPLWTFLKTYYRRRFLFLEPYYRPAWGSGGGGRGWSHEVGLMLKVHMSWSPQNKKKSRSLW